MLLLDFNNKNRRNKYSINQIVPIINFNIQYNKNSPPVKKPLLLCFSKGKVVSFEIIKVRCTSVIGSHDDDGVYHESYLFSDDRHTFDNQSRCSFFTPTIDNDERYMFYNQDTGDVYVDFMRFMSFLKTSIDSIIDRARCRALKTIDRTTKIADSRVKLIRQITEQYNKQFNEGIRYRLIKYKTNGMFIDNMHKISEAYAVSLNHQIDLVFEETMKRRYTKKSSLNLL